MPPFGNFDDEHACLLAGMINAVLSDSLVIGTQFTVGMPGKDPDGFYENAIPLTHKSGLRYDVIVRWHR